MGNKPIDILAKRLLKFMKISLCLFMVVISETVFGQNQIIANKDIPRLNEIVESLEKEYNQSNHFVYNSLHQTTASYFEIITKTPEVFISELKKSENLEELQDKFPGLQTDRDLLVIKNIYTDYNKERQFEIKSFEIENNRNHRITLAFDDSLNQKNLKYFYSTYKSNGEQTTNIKGFYLKGEFTSLVIPKIYSDWVHYTDILVKPETSVFYNNGGHTGTFYNTIIDSLVNYYENKTNKPPYNEQDYISYSKELGKWQSKKETFTDSLNRTDKHFKKLLIEALTFAEENNFSNGDLEDFTAQLISKNRALELMRQNQQVGSCSFDNSPIIQQKRIATLAAQTQNWEVFIKSFLNVMNDNVSRIANSNIASNARETYISELSKLKIDIHKILLGSSLRIEDPNEKHYFSDGSKIAKAFANLDLTHQHHFEKAIYDIISDDSLDDFNKLHFYNIYRNYQYFLEDNQKKEEIGRNIEELIPLLPNNVRSRIENPNKQLYDLLYKEKYELDKFEIKSSGIASIYSYSYQGNCWSAELMEKGSNGRVIFDLTMAIGEEITPLNNFLENQDELKSRVFDHSFLQEILNENKENKLYVEFTTDKSFTNHRNNVTKDLPQELTSILDFDNAISLYILLPNRNYVRFILLNNDNLLMLSIPKDFTLPGYKFEELMTKEEKYVFTTTYKSFKLFDENGKMLN